MCYKDCIEELYRTEEIYKQLIKHLEGHLKVKYDDTDYSQCKMLKAELRRVRAIIKMNK